MSFGDWYKWNRVGLAWISLQNGWGNAHGLRIEVNIIYLDWGMEFGGKGYCVERGTGGGWGPRQLRPGRSSGNVEGIYR